MDRVPVQFYYIRAAGVVVLIIERAAGAVVLIIDRAAEAVNLIIDRTGCRKAEKEGKDRSFPSLK